MIFFLFIEKVLSTLHEYPSLETCIPLIHYISACVRLAWKMANQLIPYYLDTDFTLGINYFKKEKKKKKLIYFHFLGLLRLEKHERHPSSDKRSDIIRAFLWPALIQNNRCVFKAVVAT